MKLGHLSSIMNRIKLKDTVVSSLDSQEAKMAIEVGYQLSKKCKNKRRKL